MSFTRQDSVLRDKLDREFRPTFEQYDHRGIPIEELKELLSDSDLPKEKMERFLRDADSDGNERITYDEFLRRIVFEDDSMCKQLRIRKRVMNRVVKAIDPNAGLRHQRSVVEERGLDTMDMYNWGEAEVDNYIEAYDCRPPPIFIPFITLVQIAVFIYYAVLHARDDDPSNDVTASSGVPINSPLIYFPMKRYQAWRFLTYMFLHSGYIHLVFNCLLQLILGTLLELVHKFWRCGLVYLLGVIAGSLAHSVSDPYVLLVGASGGNYALIGAHMASIIMNWKAMQENWLENPVNFLSSGVVRLILIVLLGGGDTGLAIYNRLTNPSQSRVGFSAHLGGFASGLLLGIPVLRNLEVEKWEKICFWVCLVVYCCFIIAAILFNGFCIRANACPPTDL